MNNKRMFTIEKKRKKRRSDKTARLPFVTRRSLSRSSDSALCTANVPIACASVLQPYSGTVRAAVGLVPWHRLCHSANGKGASCAACLVIASRWRCAGSGTCRPHRRYLCAFCCLVFGDRLQYPQLVETATGTCSVVAAIPWVVFVCLLVCFIRSCCCLQALISFARKAWSVDMGHLVIAV